MYEFRPRTGWDWDEHNIIQPLLVLAIKGGIAPAHEIILRNNAIEQGLLQYDLFGNVEFTAQGEKVLADYERYMCQFTFHD